MKTSQKKSVENISNLTDVWIFHKLCILISKLQAYIYTVVMVNEVQLRAADWVGDICLPVIITDR